jgi:hypothetical protein
VLLLKKNARKLLLLVKLLNKLLSKLRLQLLKQPRLSKKPKLLLMNLRLKLMVLVRVWNGCYLVILKKRNVLYQPVCGKQICTLFSAMWLFLALVAGKNLMSYFSNLISPPNYNYCPFFVQYCSIILDYINI